jgi:hypothetical protein
VLEVVAFAEQRFVALDGERECKAVAKVETGRMSGGLPKVSIHSAGDAGLRLGDLGELDLSDREIPPPVQCAYK